MKPNGNNKKHAVTVAQDAVLAGLGLHGLRGLGALHGLVELCVWTGSQSTAQTAEYILEFDCLPNGIENYDLWLLVQQTMRDRAGSQTLVRWIPSHMDPSLAEV